MPELVADCPRCGAKEITFDLLCDVPIMLPGSHIGCEAFCSCRRCLNGTIFVLTPKQGWRKEDWFEKVRNSTSAVNTIARIDHYVSVKDQACQQPPEHLPADIERAFREGATCVTVSCHNAACCMFRLCLDLATKPRLPEGDHEGLNAKTRRDLGLRLQWLFAHGKLPSDLQELSACVKDYGNDGAHEGIATAEDARDMLDFTGLLLEKLYTDPKRVELVAKRRTERRSASG